MLGSLMFYKVFQCPGAKQIAKCEGDCIRIVRLSSRLLGFPVSVSPGNCKPVPHLPIMIITNTKEILKELQRESLGKYNGHP